jgi:septal ring factor EnvC (AmiA/AmiB activator)
VECSQWHLDWAIDWAERKKMFGSIRLIFAVMIISGLAGAATYVMKLRSDNAILQANQAKLEQAVSSQKEVIEKQKKDFAEIMEANRQLNQVLAGLKKDIDDLDKRFNKGNRDLGKASIERPDYIEKVINRGTERANRCLEIASGSPLTEQEKNATKKEEINTECPSIANPKYVPY